jgi:hypothetical protein
MPVRLTAMLVPVVLLLVASGCFYVGPEPDGYYDYRNNRAEADDGLGLVRASLPEREGHAVYVDVRYFNNTRWDQDEVVVWCRAVDEQGFQVDAAQWVLNEETVGPIGPDFRARRKLPFPDPHQLIARVYCELQPGEK